MLAKPVAVTVAVESPLVAELQLSVSVPLGKVRSTLGEESVHGPVVVTVSESENAPRAAKLIVSVIVVLAGALTLGNCAVMLKSLRFANEPPKSVSETGVGVPFETVTQSVPTLVPLQPVLKLMGVPVVVPTTL